MIPGSCTTSDNNGISACVLKATVPGFKSVQLTNALVGLSKNVEFTISAGSQRLAIVSGGQMTAKSPNNSVAEVIVGAPVSGVKLQSAGGYLATLAIQGGAR